MKPDHDHGIEDWSRWPLARLRDHLADRHFGAFNHLVADEELAEFHELEHRLRCAAVLDAIDEDGATRLYCGDTATVLVAGIPTCSVHALAATHADGV